MKRFPLNYDVFAFIDRTAAQDETKNGQMRAPRPAAKMMTMRQQSQRNGE